MVKKERVEARMGLSTEDEKRFEDFRSRAERLGVLDINFCGPTSSDSLACYERTLEVIEKNKGRYDRNAGEA
jgi:hypothetical protein